MQASMEMLIIEGGVSSQILSESFSVYEKWVTHSWLRAVWEKIEFFGLNLEIRDLAIRFPRENDEWIMRVFAELEFNEEELHRLNRVQCHQQVLFVSNILDASGRAVDKKYLTLRPSREAWSTLIFPQERPPGRDLNLWKRALLLLAPRGRPEHQLGRFLVKGHKIWQWRYDLDKSELYLIKGSLMDIYTPALGHARQANKWRCTIQDVPRREVGAICSVRKENNGDMSVLCFTDLPAPLPTPSSF